MQDHFVPKVMPSQKTFGTDRNQQELTANLVLVVYEELGLGIYYLSRQSSKMFSPDWFLVAEKLLFRQLCWVTSGLILFQPLRIYAHLY